MIPCFSIISDPKLRKFLGKIRTAFEGITLDYDYLSDHWRSMDKKSWGNTTVCKFLQGIRFHRQRKKGANTTYIRSPKEIVNAIMMLLKNYESNGLHTWWRQHYCKSLARRYISTIFMLWTSIDLIKENGFTLKKARSRGHSTKTIIEADYADHIGLLANTPAQAGSQLHN